MNKLKTNTPVVKNFKGIFNLAFTHVCLSHRKWTRGEMKERATHTSERHQGSLLL